MGLVARSRKWRDVDVAASSRATGCRASRASPCMAVSSTVMSRVLAVRGTMTDERQSAGETCSMSACPVADCISCSCSVCSKDVAGLPAVTEFSFLYIYIRTISVHPLLIFPGDGATVPVAVPGLRRVSSICRLRLQVQGHGNGVVYGLWG